MQRLFALLAAVILLTTANAYAQLPEVILGPGLNSGRTAFNQNYNRTLSSDSAYVLTGIYYVDSTYSLSIPAGTVIFGDTAATLVISRGARIYAQGTAGTPVVFTSKKTPGTRRPGDWGGIIILGQAPLNKVNPSIEGGIIGGSYGGIDPDDTSGVFTYVRIEYPGYRFQINNEVNGLTMGGVGRGTELHHVQVSYSFDDSYEWFGGTVNASHLVALGGTDDEFDSDFGWSGKVQFAFGVRDEEYWDASGESNGFESDNDGSSTSTDQPWTEPIFSNVTLVGPARTDAMIGNLPIGNKFQYSAVIRRSSRLKIFNSVITGYPWGLSIRDVNTIAAAGSDTLQIRNLSVTADLQPSGSASVHDEGRWAGLTAWFNTAAYSNGPSTTRNPSSVGLTDMSNLNAPNPVPASGSELIGSADFSSPYLATGFTQTTYRGAFDPSKSMSEQWTAVWTNFDPQNTDYSSPTAVEVMRGEAPATFALAQNYPNPFNPSTTIRFSLPVRDIVTLKVYDGLGQEVVTLVNADLLPGSYEATFNATVLASGMYVYRLQGKTFSRTMRMMLMK